jgi:CrcB protein
MIKNMLWAGFGGFLGTVLRYTSYLVFKTTPGFYVTFLINIIGSLCIGMVMAWSLKNADTTAGWRLFLATGICGGFTTFSAFSFENLQLLQEGRFWIAFFYVSMSIFIGILACFLGYVLMK